MGARLGKAALAEKEPPPEVGSSFQALKSKRRKEMAPRAQFTFELDDKGAIRAFDKIENKAIPCEQAIRKIFETSTTFRSIAEVQEFVLSQLLKRRALAR